MARRLVKHNPAFLTPDELREAYIVRRAELDGILDCLRENTGQVNQHILVIGSRGMGKTMIVRRAALTVQDDPSLSARWIPLLFPEDVYDVATAGEFWLRAIEAVARRERNTEPEWGKIHSAARELDEERLRETALARLREYADRRNRRLAVVVENLNMILGEQADDHTGWDLRQTLLNEPRLMLIATATSRFAEIEHVDKALYDTFRVVELAPLVTADCQALWREIAGEDLSANRVRPLEVLTGGNPRLLAILASFAAGSSFRELANNLLTLIDDHTTYFKANVEALPPQERRVLTSLADIWEPAAAREVAAVARLSINTTSQLLTRLADRGWVARADQEGRRVFYQLTERLYNIYHLMRQSDSADDRVRAVVEFMARFYEPVEIGRKLAAEICGAAPDHRTDLLIAYEHLLGRSGDEETRIQILAAAPQEFVSSHLRPWMETARVGERPFGRRLGAPADVGGLLVEFSETMKRRQYDDALRLVDQAVSLARSRDGLEEAIELAIALTARGFALAGDRRYDDAESSFAEVISISQSHDKRDQRWIRQIAMARIGRGLTMIDRTNIESGLSELEKGLADIADADFPSLAGFLSYTYRRKGTALRQLGRRDEAISAFDHAIALCRRVRDDLATRNAATSAALKSYTLDELDRFDEALVTIDHSIQEFAGFQEIFFVRTVAHVSTLKGLVLGRMNRHDEAAKTLLAVYDSAGGRSDPALQVEAIRALLLAGLELEAAGRATEALAAYDVVFSQASDKSRDMARFAVDSIQSKVRVLLESGKSAEAVATCDEVLSRVGWLTSTAQTAICAAAGVTKAHVLGRQGHHLLAMEACLDVIAHTGSEGEDDQAGWTVEARNSAAWAVYGGGLRDRLPDAIGWAREAVATRPDESAFRHTLASVLGMSGQWAEALNLAREFLMDDEMIGKFPEDCIRFFVDAAAAGQAAGALAVLRESPAAARFEPLVVGLQMLVGESFRAPQEVVEVAKDVVKRIEERRAGLANESPAKDDGPH